MSVRVLIVDDQPLVRAGLRMILQAEPDIEVAGEAGDGAEAVRACAELRPDVVLMDVRMPSMNGIDATRRIVASGDDHPRVIVLTTFDVDEYVYGALRAGASGFLLKDAPEEQLIAGIRTAGTGMSLLSPGVAERLVERFAPPASKPQDARIELLTARELEVLKAVAAGRSNAEIAAELYVSHATVKSHVRSLLSKLDLVSRAQAIVFAYENRIAEPGA